jgi:hypothetical protein
MESPVDLLAGLEHLEVRSPAKGSIDAAVPAFYFESPAAGHLPQRPNVEIRSGRPGMPGENGKLREEGPLDGFGEPEELPFGRLEEGELLFPRCQRIRWHDSAAQTTEPRVRSLNLGVRAARIAALSTLEFANGLGGQPVLKSR